MAQHVNLKYLTCKGSHRALGRKLGNSGYYETKQPVSLRIPVGETDFPVFIREGHKQDSRCCRSGADSVCMCSGKETSVLIG